MKTSLKSATQKIARSYWRAATYTIDPPCPEQQIPGEEASECLPPFDRRISRLMDLQLLAREAKTEAEAIGLALLAGEIEI